MAGSSGNSHQIKGRIIDAASGEGIAGLRIEAWDKGLIFHDVVGQAETDSAGNFAIEFSGAAFQGLFHDRNPDLFFKVYRWPRSMAQYTVGHAERIRELETCLESVPGIFVAGNGYHGIGVPDCIRMGKEAAERIAKSTGMRDHSQPLPYGRGSVT